MFRLLRRKQDKYNCICKYYIPHGYKVYAVGDIHGRADLLKRMNQRIIEDAAREPGMENVLIYLGDYIDRGIEIREVIETLMNGFPDNFQTVYLLGNHEEMMLRFLDDPSLLGFWLAMGGQATLMNYRVAVPGNGYNENGAWKVQKDLIEKLPETHLSFLHGLKTSFKLGDYFFVHAGIRPGVALECQKTEDLLWIRDPFISSKADFGARIVHGHSIDQCPQVLPNRIGLDTGAYATGVLSCAVFQEDRVRLL